MLMLIKTIHSIIWAVMVLAILYVVYAGIMDISGPLVWFAISLVICEGLVLMFYRGSCPLTIVAKKLKRDYQVGDDIFLPRWLAMYNKLIFSSIFLVGLLLVTYRMMSR